ncbi:hypothetical protein [Muricoccus nepalensis]|uniref:hypothetical protein n=1 Tax=Muricoccus nepalensis TaxID=1854500 RepID=UPI001386CBF1|nr:hypothetical protein [Roseomonas nepalensis]
MPPDNAPETPPKDGRLGRRLLVLRLAGIGTASAALPGCLAAPPGYPAGPVLAATDADPSDGVGHGGHRRVYAPGRSATDADPSDGVGQGGYRRPYATGRAGTDADPSDGVGHGRFGPSPSYRGPTDNDPSDGPGRGRGTYRTPSRRAVSDNDPSDGVGRGRGWR